jgi:hypothetical protein
MATSIIERVLGNNKFYTDVYIKDTITLVKSITVKNDKEAALYNDYLSQTVSGFTPEENQAQWQYYRHLMGERYRLDQDIIAVSVDNGESFVFDKASLLIHRRTKEELLKFGLYYEELVKRYPHLELYIKGVITTPQFTSVQALVDAENFTIVSYADYLLEENENDVMTQLQLRINNYKNIWLIGYYAMADNLFLASQYHIFYNFLVTSILAIRLGHAKTMAAHSFHIRLYLASHHALDDVLLFLTKKQQLFLYRNMLYLDNHSGSNFTFQTLIDLLFSERNISVVNYVYQQRNSADTRGLMQYRYKQKLLNTKRLVYNTSDMSLDYVAGKERPLAPGNNAVYDYGREGIDFAHRNALFSEVLSKDLETILLDETDSVKYKLLQILVDNWAYLMMKGRVSFLVEVTDPATSITSRLSTRDLFKLYLIVLYASQGVALQQFPAYRVQRVFKSELPSKEQLLSGWYTMDPKQRQYVQDVLNAIPTYQYYLTSYQFEQYVTQMYKLNIGLWNLLSGYSDMDTEGQMSWVVDQLHESVDFEVDTEETVDAFLDRMGMEDPRSYNIPQLQIYLYNILDNAYDKKLSFLSRFQKLQDALTKVFFKFNSYTVQLINNYYGDAPLLVGPKDTRFHHTDEVTYDLTHVGESAMGFNLISGTSTTVTDTVFAEFASGINHHSKVHIEIELDGVLDMEIEHSLQMDQELPMSQSLVTEATAFSQELFELSWMKDATFLPVPEVGTYNEVFFDTSVAFAVRSQLVENTQRLMPINVGVLPSNENWTQVQSSDPELLFLALNLR